MKTLVKYWRNTRALEISELAEKADITPGSIINIEKHGLFPRAKTRKKLAEALGITVEQIVTEDSNPEADGPKDIAA